MENKTSQRRRKADVKRFAYKVSGLDTVMFTSTDTAAEASQHQSTCFGENGKILTVRQSKC